jgi:glycosyltransferase involved in cell wall biosynthesis
LNGSLISAVSGYCVVIPTYNNRATVADVVRRALGVAETVIVVDDGCTDGTPELLAGLPVVLVRHKKNRGKGVALRTGFAKAFELGYTHALTIDSDAQHYPEEAPKLMDASRREPDAIVIGVRDMSGVNVPAASTLGRKLSNFWMRLATGVEAHDTQSGFRVYPLRHVTRVSCFSRRFTFECELLVRAAWGNCPVVSVPIRVHYAPKGERVSHFNPLWDNVRFFFLYTYLNFRHLLVPFPHRRLVAAKDPLWAGSLGATLKNGARKLRELAALPPKAQLSGGPFSRMKQLVKYLVHENNTPGELGAAAGIGAFIGCTPLIGFQWLIALYAGTRMHLNRIAAVAATNVSFGPLTAVIAIASVMLGKALTGNHEYFPTETLNFAVLWPFLLHSLGHWILGSLIIGAFAAVVVGLGTMYGVRAMRRAQHAGVSLDYLPSLTPPNGVNSADIHAALEEAAMAEKGAEAAA